MIETHNHITKEDCYRLAGVLSCSTTFFKPVLMAFVFYNPCVSIVLWIYAKGQSCPCVNKLSKKKILKGKETTDFARFVVLHLSGDFMSAVSILTNLSSSLLCTLGYESDYISSQPMPTKPARAGCVELEFRLWTQEEELRDTAETL